LARKELCLSKIFKNDGRTIVFAFGQNIFSLENPQNMVENFYLILTILNIKNLLRVLLKLRQCLNLKRKSNYFMKKNTITLLICNTDYIILKIRGSLNELRYFL